MAVDVLRPRKKRSSETAQGDETRDDHITRRKEFPGKGDFSRAESAISLKLLRCGG